MDNSMFQIEVSDEEKEYAIKLVDYSIIHHPVKDIFANDPNAMKRQREFRYTGTLGEVVFADVYGLSRPKRSFGAIDGQDYGEDFKISVNGNLVSVDIKSMHRKNNLFRGDYVLNIASYQLHKDFSLTDYYFCISFHSNEDKTYGTFVGFVKKEDILNGNIGELFLSGSKRNREDNSSFVFLRDTYEIKFKDILPPSIPEDIKMKSGFRKIRLLK